ncbi:MAG: hypothetical protein HY906_07190 [Deltaproteobacteria bacterium]|nr:hypothetical protein [Deltaproteobacteria bacterium]
MRRSLVALALVAAVAPGTGCADKPGSRPAGAAKGKPVAVVLLAKGAVVARDEKGTEFPVKKDLGLLESDTVVVPAAGLVALHLVANGYVVRLDDELILPVSEIALLRAPRKDETLGTQLEALLTPDERQQIRERMVGWYVSPTAANVPGLRPEREVEEEQELPAIEAAPAPLPPPGMLPTSATPEPRPAGRAKSIALEDEAPPPPPKPAAPPPQARWPAAPAEEGERKENAAPRGDGTKKDDAMRKKDTAGVGGGTGSTGLGTGPAQSAEGASADAGPPSLKQLLEGDLELRRCLGDYLQLLGPSVATAVGQRFTVRVRLVNGTPVIRLPRALPPPVCAAKFFQARAAGLPAVLDFEVTLE